MRLTTHGTLEPAVQPTRHRPTTSRPIPNCMTMTPSEVGKRRLGTPTKVFIGLALGLLVGVFFGEQAAFLRIGGDIFIAMLQITVIPYVVVALITSLGRLTIKDAKALAFKAGAVLLTLWGIGLIVVLSSPLAFPDWPSASFFSTSQIEERAPVDFLQLYIPSNIFASLSNAIVPAVVVFSMLFGVALIRVEHKERIVDTLGGGRRYPDDHHRLHRPARPLWRVRDHRQRRRHHRYHRTRPTSGLYRPLHRVVADAQPLGHSGPDRESDTAALR